MYLCDETFEWHQKKREEFNKWRVQFLIGSQQLISLNYYEGMISTIESCMRNKIQTGTITYTQQVSNGGYFVLLPCKSPKVNIKFDKLFGWFISKEKCCIYLWLVDSVVCLCVRKHHWKSNFIHVEVVNVIPITYITLYNHSGKEAKNHLRSGWYALFLEEWEPNWCHSYQGYFMFVVRNDFSFPVLLRSLLPWTYWILLEN